MRKDNGGMSFIEVILTIVIISLLTTGSIAIYKSLGYANTKKAANHINDSLSRARIDTLSKKGIQYLYLYQINGKLYSKLTIEEGLSIGLTGELTSTDGKGYSSNITLSYKTDTGIRRKLENNESIVISFVKGSGAFASNYTELILDSGNSSSTILCVKETGRHWIH